MPIGTLDPAAYLSQHVEAQLDNRQATALRRILNGLNERHAKLAGGRYVQNGADAVRWLLEQVAELTPARRDLNLTSKVPLHPDNPKLPELPAESA